MKAIATGVLATVASVTVALGGVVAPPASAVTWTRTTSTTDKAYSWTGYKATVKPRGFTVPSGYQKLSAKLTIKRYGTTVVSGVSSARLSPGTYTAYSTFTYRSKTAYTAYRTVDVSSIDAETCEASRAPVDTGGTWAIVPMMCSGVGWDIDYNEVRGTFELVALLAADDAAYAEALALASASWDDYALIADWEVIATGTPVPGDSFSYGVAPSGDGTGSQAYTAYRYGPTRTAYRYRTVYVTKIVNTAVMTRTEYNAFGSGDSLSRVRAITGSSGELVYMSGGFDVYRWHNTSGSYTYVWFYYGTWYDDAWYTS